MKYRCRWCGVVFIGPCAVMRWSEHTWVHARIVDGEVLTDPPLDSYSEHSTPAKE